MLSHCRRACDIGASDVFAGMTCFAQRDRQGKQTRAVLCGSAVLNGSWLSYAAVGVTMGFRG